jgi:hypothetical protein|tara:strand:- start:1573 stop:2277 length:705 start_codon:yes stop_codon:yes gene_type:complete
MRKINIANEKKRDALVGFEAKPTKVRIKQVLKDGTERKNIKILKSTLQTDISCLAKQYSELEELSQAIINSDIDCDIETTGMYVGNTTKIYADSENKIVFNVELLEVLKDKDGSEISRKALETKDSNIAIDSYPIVWSGRLIPKLTAAKKFVFSRHYQIRHVNGLSFDFLFDMAKELDSQNALVAVGAGKKGNEPILVAAGGTPYRGFLEGRVKNNNYCLILHLTNLELKEFKT